MKPERKTKNIDLSVIVACYNEIQILHKNIKELTEFLDHTKLSYELILIDDCSEDGTRQEIPKLVEKYPKIKWNLHKKNLGRGGTVAEGIKMAKGDVVGFIDIDLEIGPVYILPAYIEIKKGYDVVVGHRIYKLNLKVWGRFIVSRGYNFLMKNLLDVPLIDTETGFKFFNKKRILPILDEVKDEKWFWDTEIMVRPYHKKFKIKEMPVLFIKKGYKISTVKIFKDSLDYFKKLIKFRKEIKKLKNEI